MNNIVLIGNLARDPELRYTTSGKAVCRLTVAVNRGWGKDKGADFIPVEVWERQAESCASYLTKGSKVGVMGRLKVRKYEVHNETRWATDVVAREVEFLGGGPSQPQGQHRPNTSAASQLPDPADIDLSDFEAMEDDDDLPF